ncbi:MAG: 3-hydroxyacyl-CoA dehydrogenase family protein, partial [Burkholderiales bacterium]
MNFKTVGVAGSGTMGAGIAIVAARAGFRTVVYDTRAEALARARSQTEGFFAKSVERGKLTQEQVSKILSGLSGTTDIAALAGCDIVIEAVFEDLGVQEAVFKQLDETMKPGAILASNTSTLDLDRIAAFTKRPGDVIGMHFFSPANVMRLLEVVRGEKSAKDVVATAMSVGRRIAKVPVCVGVCYGFVGNRMLHQRGREAEKLILE